jgi:SAM-dependent methyltransferase
VSGRLKRYWSHLIMGEAKESVVARLYRSVQIVNIAPEDVDFNELTNLQSAWQHPGTPALQDVVSRHQISEFLEGRVDPVFVQCIEAVKLVAKDATTYLDLACGGGYYSVIVRRTAPSLKYVGADYSAAMVEKARENYPGVDFLVQDATNTTFDDRSFDAVMLSGALEHIPNYEKAIAELCRVADKYIVLHRALITEGSEIRHTKGSQYNIVTPRIYYPVNYLVDRFAQGGFEPISQRPTYPNAPNTLTFVFARSHPPRILELQERTAPV